MHLWFCTPVSHLHLLPRLTPCQAGCETDSLSKHNLFTLKMQFTQVLSSALLLLTSATAVFAAPIEERKTCKNLAVRKEWLVITSFFGCFPRHVLILPPYRRTLSKAEKLDYIGAVKCLMALPAQTGGFFAGAKTRYDDFLALHINSTDYVHFNVSLNIPEQY